MEHGLLKARVLRCALIAILAALLPLTALADFVNVSGTDVVTISTAPGAEEFAVDFGTVCAGSNATKTVQLAIVARSHADPGGTIFYFADGSLVTLAVAATTGSGLSATIAPPSAILLPANWASLPDGTLSSAIDSTLTLNTASLGAFTGTVVYSGSGTSAAGGPLTKFSTLDVKANVVTCGTADVKVEKKAASANINAGDTASFTITVTSLGPLAANNVVLTDVLPSGLTWTVSGADATAAGCAGTLAGGSTLTCNFGTLAGGATRTVTLSATTSTSNCGQINNTANVNASNDSDSSNNSSSASMTVTCPPPPSAQFAPTQTTCQNFRDGTASSLSAINYHLKNGVINNVSPGVAFYYVKLSAPAAGGTFTISVNQSDNGSTPAFGTQQVLVYSIDCNRYANVSTSTSNGNTTITVNGAAANQPFIVSVKVDPSPVVGSATPSPTTVTYTYVTLVNGTTVPGSSQSIALAP
jgi:uncharacterized repeat protein (TIGR01451 family)